MFFVYTIFNARSFAYEIQTTNYLLRIQRNVMNGDQGELVAETLIETKSTTQIYNLLLVDP